MKFTTYLPIILIIKFTNSYLFFNKTNSSIQNNSNLIRNQKMIELLDDYFESTSSKYKEDLHKSYSNSKKKIKDNILVAYKPSERYTEYIVNFKLYILKCSSVIDNINIKLDKIKDIYQEIVKDGLETLIKSFDNLMLKLKIVIEYNITQLNIVVNDLNNYREKIKKEKHPDKDKFKWLGKDLKNVFKQLISYESQLKLKISIADKMRQF